MSNHESHLWGIILAGGEGKRLQSFIKTRFGEERPKQFCTFVGTRSMLRHTVDRAKMLMPEDRLLTVVNHSHLKYVEEQLYDQPMENIIVQPLSRETGPGILLPLLHIAHRDPEAVVAVFPSDHFILDEQRFAELVRLAYGFALSRPHLPVVLGIDPKYPEPGYGWIEKGYEILR